MLKLRGIEELLPELSNEELDWLRALAEAELIERDLRSRSGADGDGPAYCPGCGWELVNSEELEWGICERCWKAENRPY